MRPTHQLSVKTRGVVDRGGPWESVARGGKGWWFGQGGGGPKVGWGGYKRPTTTICIPPRGDVCPGDCGFGGMYVIIALLIFAGKKF